MRRLALALLVVLVTVSAAGSSRKRAHRKSPHAEITAVALVETAPRRTTHKNRREFEEFDVRILSAQRSPDIDAAGDPNLTVETQSRVHVVHDLSCGGSWVDAQPGDRVEIKGEYVQPSRGRALIHFTHPSGTCGRNASHPDGYLRPAPPAGAAAEATGRAPAEDLFTTAVRPVLARRCAPCHEKGGKMYARLPFDDPTVVSSHAAGARKRLKGDDLATLERWLATLPAAPVQPEAPQSY